MKPRRSNTGQQTETDQEADVWMIHGRLFYQGRDDGPAQHDAGAFAHVDVMRYRIWVSGLTGAGVQRCRPAVEKTQYEAIDLSPLFQVGPV